MKTTIRDKDALQKLSPLSFSSYLSSNHWHELKDNDEQTSVWIKDDEEILIPVDPSLRDYPLRIFEALRTLEDVEARDQSQIYRDVSRANFDCIRISVNHSGIKNGNIPIEIGARMYSKAYDLVAASAYSTNSPKPFYRGGRPKAVNDYLKQTKFGQSEEGRYIVTILSPVAPRSDKLRETPFSRLVTEKLHSSLNALLKSTVEYASKKDIEIFKEVIKTGISANFCDAVSGMIGEEGLDINANFSWSSALQKYELISNSDVKIAADYFNIIEDVSKYLKEISPLEDFEADCFKSFEINWKF